MTLSHRSLVKHVTLHKTEVSDILGVHFYQDYEVREKSAARAVANLLSCGIVKDTEGLSAGLLPRGARVVTIDGEETLCAPIACMKLKKAVGDIVVGYLPPLEGVDWEPQTYQPWRRELPEPTPSEQTDEPVLLTPSRVWYRSDGVVQGSLVVPEAAGDALSVDVWPQTTPKMIVSVPVPAGLKSGDRFCAELVKPPPVLPLNGALARPTHGSMHFEFPAEQGHTWPLPRLGVDIELGRRKLVIADVASGTWAARLNVPVGSTVTHICGHELKGSAKRQIELMQRCLHVRPLRMSVHVAPPVDALRSKGPRRSYSFQLFKSKSSWEKRRDATPIGTPSDTHRSSDIDSPASTSRAQTDAAYASPDLRFEVRQVL